MSGNCHSGGHKRAVQNDMPRLQEFERAVQVEIKNAKGQEEMFLRASSGLSCLLKEMGHNQGRAYFRYVLREVFGEKTQVYSGPTSPSQVLIYTKTILQRLAKAINFAPMVLRAGCQYVLTEFKKAFPESKKDTTIVVGSLLFLRILCPALIKPEVFGFQPHSPKSLPAGVQIAKMLQHTLNGSLMNENHPEFAACNSFIYTFQPFVASFLAKFPQIRPSYLLCEFPREGVLSAPSWDMDDTPETPSPNSWDVPPSKMRGMSASTDENIKSKRSKFSLRFWSRLTSSLS